MKREPVVSSSVASVGYDPRTYELQIEYQGGKVYSYAHVPMAAYRLLLRAPSIGEYVNRIIKPRFQATRVD